MIKRLTSVALIICFLCLIFCSCGEEESVNIIYPITADPECLDPQIIDNETAKIITTNCMEGLVRISADGKILPGVAKSWEVSSDGLVYTFKLRNDAKWQMLRSHSKVIGEDYESTFSTTVTAADCAFGIERALRPETKAENAYLLYPIRNAEDFNSGKADRNSLGISVVDDTTLVISLERVCDDFLRILAEPMCMPCDEEFFNLTGAKYGLELKYTLCNGPFYIGKWLDDTSITLYRNENYSGYSDFKTDAVYMYLNNEESQFISKFNQGDYNAATISPANISLVNKDATILKTSNKTYGFIFNCDDSILSEDNIRKAFVNAIDISAMNIDSKSYTNAGGVVPEACSWGAESYRKAVNNINMPAFNSENAVSYFDKGLKSLDVTNINISIICPEEFRKPVIRMIQKWEKLFGLAITVSVSAVEEDDLHNSVKKGEYQIAFTQLNAEDGNVLCFLDMFTSENESNFANYQSKKYDEIIDKCKKQYSASDILSGYKSAESMLITEGVFYPVYNDNSYLCVRDSATDVFGCSGFSNIDFAMWVADDEK